MATDFLHRRNELNSSFHELAEGNPDVMAGFAKMHRAAAADRVLAGKVKELIALAISITSHYEGYVGGGQRLTITKY
jgi:alkylhydroperoxidase/carboxymuconolactone decarboxylase family protein YurZ